MSPKPSSRLPIAENPSDEMPAEEAVASLLARVSAARVLREHHIWEAVRILPDSAGLSADIRQSPCFRAAMDRNALREALSMIATACQPARRFHVLGREQDKWVCVLQSEEALAPPRHRIIRTTHADPAAAILAGLLRSCRALHAEPARRMRPRAGMEKAGIEQAGIEQGAFHG